MIDFQQEEFERLQSENERLQKENETLRKESSHYKEKYEELARVFDKIEEQLKDF